MTDSQQLLAEYARNGSDAAFRELVARYVDLVYSTALRLVEGDTHRAEDVAQTVFVDLARLARTLSHEVMPGGWLHRHTCFVAANTLRGERRRQSRERQAVEMNVLQNHSVADFSQVAPLLDEAINELGEADRTAILLRFFEQHDFRSVGQALGSNEDAARMRVTRALEKLETLLKRRGVTASSGALAVVLGANAVQAAPVGLAVTISTAAAITGTTIAATATATAVKTIGMTTLQKTIIGATLVAAVGTGIYEARQASNARTQVERLRQQQTALAEQIQQLTRERDAARSTAAVNNDESERLRKEKSELLRLRGEVAVLRRQTSEMADLKVEPAYQDQTLSDWLRSLDKSPLQFTELTVDTNQSAAQAFLQIGSKAVPYLLRELRSQDYVRQRRAIQACYALGPIAKAAIPELAELVNEGRISQTLRTFALAAMGPDGLPYMISALANRDAQVRIYMASALRYVLFDAEAAVPALITCLSDAEDYRVRCEAAYALANIKKRPDLVVPALTQNLTDTNEMVRFQTASALARFRAALPEKQ
jgi:RNA polymerase sigma factor (sigma-70 family)